MHIDRLSIREAPPIDNFEINTPSNVIIIAGANGCGKTRLKQAIVETFQTPDSPKISVDLSDTRPQEEEAWGARTLAIRSGHACPVLAQYWANRTKGNAFTGTVVQIDSDRAVQPVKFQPLSLATTDPDDDAFDYRYYLNPFVGRWQTLVNNIYRKVANRDQRIAKFVRENPEQPGSVALERHPDPFLPYQEMFGRLLPGKSLEPIDPKAPRDFYYRLEANKPMVFGTLSSGEKEVVKVAFDLVWKRISHSVILIDEPELHLHPTLAFRLVETLKELGGGTNQLILFTHSADLISTYYATGNVFFISVGSGANQAQQLSNLHNDHTNVARMAGANLGLFAVGRRLLFVEGKEASVDRLLYHRVAQAAFPSSYVMPLGSVENVVALRAVVEELAHAVFGLELFMIRDRDGLTDGQVCALEQNPRFRCLPRRHVENYLLDAQTLADVAAQFHLDKALRDVTLISSRLEEIAGRALMTAVLWNVREHIRLQGAITQPKVSGVDQMAPEQLAVALTAELERSLRDVADVLDEAAIRAVVGVEHAKLEASLSNGTWRSILPGKLIFGRFCSEVFNVEQSRVREAYVDIAARQRPTVFQDVAEILTHFSDLCALPTD